MSVIYQLRAFLAQSFWIPTPPLTEHNLPDQSGRVCIITGGYAGVGFELVSILYQHNATIYVAGRSESKAASAIDKLMSLYPQSSGRLHFLNIDLSDLTTIKPAVQNFLRRESKLHWLNNNAGIMHPPENSKGSQGHDLQYQTNIYGPFLLTKLLEPVLKSTAALETPGTVRVTWAGSLATIIQTPTGGVAWTEDGSDFVDVGTKIPAYHLSKAANYLLAVEFGKRFRSTDSVLHLGYNPGNLLSELQRHAPKLGFISFSTVLLGYPARMGAYTELYAGMSEDLTLEKDQGGWVVPWGRTYPMRPDMLAEVEKEKGTPWKTFEWCDKITKEWQ